MKELKCIFRPVEVRAVFYDGTLKSAEQVKYLFKYNQKLCRNYQSLFLNSVRINSHRYIVGDPLKCQVYTVSEFEKLFEIISAVSPQKIWYEFEYVPCELSSLHMSLHDRLADIMNRLEITDYTMICKDVERAQIEYKSAMFVINPDKIEVSFRDDETFANDVYMAVHDHFESTNCHTYSFKGHSRTVEDFT